MCQWLKDNGYSHCFALTGGNIMHLIESASRYFTVIPVVHEVAAGIATEYYNETEVGSKAFALVTAGPGLTNILTAIAGSYLESRELLILGGTVKTNDRLSEGMRQRGIQEIDGVNLVTPITKKAFYMDRILNKTNFLELANISNSPRKGPVFIEIPLDIQAKTVNEKDLNNFTNSINSINKINNTDIDGVLSNIKKTRRPIILLGGGISRKTAKEIYKNFNKQSVPVMTTWNAADRICSHHNLYFGRPNTWGQRYSNILLQESDLLVAIGTRLGIQQTGFNWQEFMPRGEIIHIDCDPIELEKGHPSTKYKYCVDANDLIKKLLRFDLGDHNRWLEYCNQIKEILPIYEYHSNHTGEEYISPYKFYQFLSDICRENDVIIPCSSGGAYTTFQQSFMQKKGQVIVSNKGLASMGYGLSGAIGASIANCNKKTILIEGDGGFSQNLQELATVKINKLNMKIFIFDDNGYASIRITQKNYFNGKYIGCDIDSGLGFPNWDKLFNSYDISSMQINNDFPENDDFLNAFNSTTPYAFIVPIDPEQTYFPKITSKVTSTGNMKSNPIHLMHPEITIEQQSQIDILKNLFKDIL